MVYWKNWPVVTPLFKSCNAVYREIRKKVRDDKEREGGRNRPDVRGIKYPSCWANSKTQDPEDIITAWLSLIGSGRHTTIRKQTRQLILQIRGRNGALPSIN